MARPGGRDYAKAGGARARWLVAYRDALDDAKLALSGGRSSLPILYTGRWAWSAYLRAAPPPLLDTIRRRYLLWLASYNGGAGPKRTIDGYPWSVWQYTGKGRVPGVDGACDINVYVEGAI